jgi:hypothetical protein
MKISQITEYTIKNVCTGGRVVVSSNLAIPTENEALVNTVLQVFF